MKYQEELTLITYKIDEIREDLKELTRLEDRISRLERCMYVSIGAITLIATVMPILLLFLHTFLHAEG